MKEIKCFLLQSNGNVLQYRLNKKSIYLLAIALLLTLPLWSQQSLRLFESNQQLSGQEAAGFHHAAEASGRVKISSKVYELSHADIGKLIEIELFDSQTMVATIDRLNHNVNGTKTLRARLLDDSAGYLLLSVTGDDVLGTISAPARKERFVISSENKSGTIFLHKLDQRNSSSLEGSEPLSVENEQIFNSQDSGSYKSVNEIKNIDVMVVYTPAAAQWANQNEGNILNTIAQAIELGQLALENSETLMTVTLVYSPQIAYVETGNASTDLQNLTYTNGVIDEVQDWRDQYGADLVCLFSLEHTTGGLGWLLQNLNGNSSIGYSITRVQQASWTYTAIHEMGHNMGCHHHKQQNVQPGPTNWQNWPDNLWSAGWRWTGNDNEYYASVMTYSDGQYFPDGIDHARVPYFSNPTVTYQGVATGHATNGDNARTLREIRHTIAAYRDLNYTITTSSNPTAGGTTSGGGSYQNGQSCTVSASANSGYTFSNWTEGGNVVSSSPSFNFTVTGNRNLVANFTLNPVNYTITASSNPTAGGTTIGGGTFASGSSRTVTATASNGYTFSNWTEGGNVVSNNASYTFTLSGNRTLVANFILNPEVKIGNVTSGPGQILVPVEMLNFTQNVNSFTFKITANSNLLTFNELVNVTGFASIIAIQNGNTLGLSYSSIAGHQPNGKVFDLKFNYTATASTNLDFQIQQCEVTAGIHPISNIIYTNGVITNTQPVCNPFWTPLPNLQFNMQLVAQILIDGQISLNPNDVLGAFVGGECRGIASPDPAQDGKIFLTIGSNIASGEQIELKIWNSNTCSDCNAIPGFAFVNQAEVGTFLEPYQLRCGAIQDITFGQGFTWFSVNVNPGSMSPASLFTDLTPCYDDRVIGQTSFALYTGSNWIGSLTNLGMDKMYRMKLCSQQNLSLMGDAAVLNPISLNAGYTWLGYQPQQCQSVSAAMAGLSPGPSYDDRVIGQSSFALFTGTTWIGSLTQMCPGKGYVVKLANAQTLTYTAPSAKGSSGEPEAIELVSPTGIYPALNHQHTMMVVAKLQLPYGMILLNEKDVVYAYINGEVRGMANPMPDADGAIFLSIADNEDLSKPITFMLWLDDRQELLPLNETLSFEAFAAVGDLNNPFIFTLGEMVGVNEADGGIWIGEPYPNPFTEQTVVPYRLSATAKLKVTVFNNMGQLLKDYTVHHDSKGTYHLELNKETLQQGIYKLLIQVETGQRILNFSKSVVLIY